MSSPDKTAAPKLELRDVHKAYGDKTVLNGMDLKPTD